MLLPLPLPLLSGPAVPSAARRASGSEQPCSLLHLPHPYFAARPEQKSTFPPQAGFPALQQAEQPPSKCTVISNPVSSEHCLSLPPGSESPQWMVPSAWLGHPQTPPCCWQPKRQQKCGFWLTFWRLLGLCCLDTALHTYSSLRWLKSRGVDIAGLHPHQNLIISFSFPACLSTLTCCYLSSPGGEAMCFCSLAARRRERPELLVPARRVIPSSEAQQPLHTWYGPGLSLCSLQRASP